LPAATPTIDPDIYNQVPDTTVFEPSQCTAVLNEPAPAYMSNTLGGQPSGEIPAGGYEVGMATEAWEGNWTWECFLAFAWQGSGDERLLVTVNYVPNQSQCYLQLPFVDLSNGHWRLEDLIGDATYDREGNDLHAYGLYLDEPPWQAHVFSLTKRV
jgi:hypothetical protein